LKTPEIRARKCLITKKYFLRFGVSAIFLIFSQLLTGYHRRNFSRYRPPPAVV